MAMMVPKCPERKYEDFDPVSDLISEDKVDTLVLYLPGFKKQQLKVQLTTSRILRISGERPVGDNNWRRFSKEFRVPHNVDTKEITAKFEGGILHIRQPKLITPAADGQPGNAKPAVEAAKPQTQHQDASSHPQQERKTNAAAATPTDLPGSTEAKAEKKEEAKEDAITARREEDKTSGKDEEPEGKCDLTGRYKCVVYGSGLFKELRKPEKQKKLAIFVVFLLVLMILGFCITNLFRSYSGKEPQSILEYEHQEF